jgi:hypothetical protein
MVAMGMTKALVATFVCVALAGCGGKKDGDKKKDDTPAPAPAPPPGAPKAGGPGAMGLPGGLGGGALAGLFGGATAKKKESPMKGLFGGGGINLGMLGEASKTAAVADTDKPGAPAPPAPPPPPDPGKPGPEGGPSCAAIAQHILTVAKDELAGQPPEAAAQMTEAFTQMCTQMSWSLEARQCFMNATEESAFEKCGDLIAPSGGGMEPGDGDGDGDMPQMPQVDMTATAPVPSGNPDCDAMAASLVPTLLAAEMGGGDVPPEAKAMMEQMKFGIQNQIAAVCAQAKWPKEAIQCVGAAKNEQDLTTCAGKYNLTGG